MRDCRVTIGSERLLARRGEVLLDAAILNGVDIQHDCRSGICGMCRLRVVEGVIHPPPDDDGVVHACQARIVSDVTLVAEAMPESAVLDGRVEALVPVAPDVIEVVIALDRRTRYRPGQYYRVRFHGFPSRCYSPTVPLDRFGDDDTIHLHVRRIAGGEVSSAFGSGIERGHRLRLEGPFGAACFRPRMTGRIVLVAGGTGFAPIWSIADAAMREDHERTLVLVAGARSIESLYMIPALTRLADCRRATIVPVTETPQRVSPIIRSGTPLDHLPELGRGDVVYAAGPPQLVEGVKMIARAQGVPCHADPFLPSASLGLRSRLLERFRAKWMPARVKEMRPNRELESRF